MNAVRNSTMYSNSQVGFNGKKNMSKQLFKGMREYHIAREKVEKQISQEIDTLLNNLEKEQVTYKEALERVEELRKQAINLYV